MANKEVVLTAQTVTHIAGRAKHPVPLVGYHQKVEILAGLDQGIHHLHGRGGVDVHIELADHQQEVSLKVLCVVDAGRRRIGGIERPPHPLLVPIDLVHAVVVATGISDSDLIEFRMELERAQGVLTAR